MVARMRFPGGRWLCTSQMGCHCVAGVPGCGGRGNVLVRPSGRLLALAWCVLSILCVLSLSSLSLAGYRCCQQRIVLDLCLSVPPSFYLIVILHLSFCLVCECVVVEFCCWLKREEQGGESEEEE